MLTKKVNSPQEVSPGDLLRYITAEGDDVQGTVINTNGRTFENKVCLRREIKPGIIVQEWVDIENIHYKMERMN